MNDDAPAEPRPVPPPGATPTGYQRTGGGGMCWQPPSVERLQALLPGYEILALIGHGGMGAVYKARQKSLDRLVAIKILPPEVAENAGSSFVERFRNEARTMAKMNHPAIVHVYDYGETAEGQLYFVMEFVEGTDVQQMISSSGRLPAEHALAIAAHVCDALHYAHTLGVIHRDIKPANVLINRDGEVKVADFGLAKLEDSGQTPGLTMTGMSMGTPDYAAPEALTSGMVADHRADLYAVGVMLYHMLTGEVPRGKVRMPSQKVGSDVRFDAIIDRAMENDRQERYQSAVDIRRDLDTILTTPLVQAGGPGSAAIPRAMMAEGGPPQSGRGIPANFPPAPRSWLIPAVLASVAALGIGAWWMLKPAPQGDTLKAAKQGSTSLPAPVSEAHAPQAAKPVPPSSIAAAKPPPVTVAATTPKPASKPSPVPTSTAAPKAVSPIPGGPGISATALHDAAAPKAAPAAGQSSAKQQPAQASSAAPSGDGLKPRTTLPTELAALDAQFQKLQAERVTAPFETDVLTLNTGYLGGIDREMAKEKAAGHLDAILALEEEKKLITDKQPLPETDDDKTPAALKTLRGIYHTAYGKIEATRTANLKVLTDPLDARLAGLETDFAKKDRVADAKVVREYREALAQSSPGLQPEIPSPPPLTAATTATTVKPLAPAAVLAAKDGYTNSLGMKFVPVRGTKVLFCIHTTRVKDYAAYAAQTPGVNGEWKTQKKAGVAISDKEDDPVVDVSWDDANAFCAWLSKKEGKTCRLPTDREWSCAVGIGQMEKVTQKTTPESLSGKVDNVYPWGNQWPPPKGAGNYADTMCKAKFPAQETIAGYTDGYAATSPVMSFKPNKAGLYDMGGNVWQWCEDWCNTARVDRVLRGGAWDNYERGNLLSSHRGRSTSNYRDRNHGFRVVVVGSGG